jgi:hypothetical protein
MVCLKKVEVRLVLPSSERRALISRSFAPLGPHLPESLPCRALELCGCLASGIGSRGSVSLHPSCGARPRTVYRSRDRDDEHTRRFLRDTVSAWAPPRYILLRILKAYVDAMPGCRGPIFLASLGESIPRADYVGSKNEKHLIQHCGGHSCLRYTDSSGRAPR